ncbi:MAG: hypothetical protein ACUVV5_03025 [Candidatus Aminicenantales bacterium]
MTKVHSFLVGLLFLFTACGGDVYRKVRLELPAYSPVKLADYQEILITDFLVTKEPEGLNLNREIQEYFKLELEKKFRGHVFLQPFPVEGKDAFGNPEIWKPLAQPNRSRLILTGVAGFIQETRKAILSRPSRRPEEENLTPSKNVEERRVFTLELTLYLLNPETGQPLLQRDFKETMTYAHLQQRPDFAFHDLAQRVRVKLFRPILGEERTEERYLLLK